MKPNIDNESDTNSTTTNTTQLPKGWLWTSLHKLGIIVSGGTPSTNERKYWGGNIPWVTPADLSDYKLKGISKGRRDISQAGLDHSSALLLPKGSLIFSSRAPIGYVAITQNALATNQGFKNLIPTTSTNIDYLFHYLKSAKQEAIKRASGTTFLEISAQKFGDIPVPLAPKSQQYAIVLKIEELFSELDKTFGLLSNAEELLKVYRQVILNRAFNGDLTKDWRTTNITIPAKQLLQQINIDREESYKDEIKNWKKLLEVWTKTSSKSPKPLVPKRKKHIQISEEDFCILPILPDGWTYTRVANISTVSTGKTPLKSRSDYYRNGTIAWVASGALNDLFVKKPTLLITELAVKENNLRLYKRNTLLVALYGEGKTRGKCSELQIESTTNQAIAAISQEKTEENLRNYLKWFFLKNYIELRSMAAGGAQQNLNLGIIERTIVPIANSNEINVIVNELERKFSIIENLEETINKCRDRLDVLRHTIYRKAFSGKLITDENIDISAEELIEQIKEEKKNIIIKQKSQNKTVKKFTMDIQEKNLLDLLKEAGEPMSAEDLWKQSKFKDNIEDFYAELKKVQNKIVEINKGMLTLRDASR